MGKMIQRIKNAPLWWHFVFLGFLFAFGRILLADSVTIGALLLLAFLVFLVGPVWFVPLLGQDHLPLAVQLVGMLFLAALYFSPLFLVKRGDQYKNIFLYNKTWIRLIIAYSIVNLVSACIVIPRTLNHAKKTGEQSSGAPVLPDRRDP